MLDTSVESVNSALGRSKTWRLEQSFVERMIGAGSGINRGEMRFDRVFVLLAGEGPAMHEPFPWRRLRGILLPRD